MAANERPATALVLSAGAAGLWILFCLRWFDAGAAFRPPGLDRLPPLLAAAAAAAALVTWAASRAGRWRDALPPELGRLAAWAVMLAVAFRLPLAWWGAAGYTTADAALSGIVALRVRDGLAHDVFIPQIPYSGSLKSHLTALLALAMDPARAFALASLAFYAAFVAGAVCLALRAAQDRRVALAAGLYLAFAPAFVTHYSLSNDGNYVEVLAFGTWALALAADWLLFPARRGPLGFGIGLLLGLGFWCHVLAVLHALAIGVVLLAAAPRDALRALPRLGAGFTLGGLPALLWNAGHGWETFRALLPGAQPAGVSSAGPGLAQRALLTLTDHAPVLLGYDPGHEAGLDLVLRVGAWLGVAAVAFALARAASEARGGGTLALLLVFVGVNLVVAVAGLRYVPGNPRYLLFLMAPLPILLARALSPSGAGRAALALLVVLGAAGSLLQGRGEVAEDARWRGFVAELEREGVRHCTSDFYVAVRVTFLTQQRVVCSSKLGPTRTEYFFEFRERVERARDVALVAASAAQAEKIERRLARLGVAYERRDLMKPVLLPRSRQVDPQELFPDQSFEMR